MFFRQRFENLLHTMPLTNKQIAAGSFVNITLKSATKGLTISTQTGIAKVFIDSQSGLLNAIKHSAGFSSPFWVEPGAPRAIAKEYFKTEKIKISVQQASVLVIYET